METTLEAHSPDASRVCPTIPGDDITLESIGSANRPRPLRPRRIGFQREALSRMFSHRARAACL